MVCIAHYSFIMLGVEKIRLVRSFRTSEHKTKIRIHKHNIIHPIHEKMKEPKRRENNILSLFD